MPLYVKPMTVFVAPQNRGRPDRTALNHLLSLHRKAIMSPGIVTKLIFVHHMSMKRFRTQDHRRQGRWKRLYGVIVPLLPCHDRLEVLSDVVGRRNWSVSNLLRIASSAMGDMLRTGTLAETLGEVGGCGSTLPKGCAGPGLAPVPDRDDRRSDGQIESGQPSRDRHLVRQIIRRLGTLCGTVL